MRGPHLHSAQEARGGACEAHGTLSSAHQPDLTLPPPAPDAGASVGNAGARGAAVRGQRRRRKSRMCDGAQRGSIWAARHGTPFSMVSTVQSKTRCPEHLHEQEKLLVHRSYHACRDLRLTKARPVNSPKVNIEVGGAKQVDHICNVSRNLKHRARRSAPQDVRRAQDHYHTP
jgi:hypothetical protein